MRRRSFLRYAGAGVAAGLVRFPLGPLSTEGAPYARVPWSAPDGRPDWTQAPYPIPLPGDTVTGRRAPLDRFEVKDDLLVPPEFEARIVASWGDVLGAATFGYNCDYIGIVQRKGRNDEFWIVVNHEYISARPWTLGFEEVKGKKLPAEVRFDAASEDDDFGSRLVVDGKDIGTGRVDLSAPPNDDVDEATLVKLREFARLAAADLGVTIILARTDSAGALVPVPGSADHKRIGVTTGVNISAAHRFSGPAAPLLGAPLGTVSNCSGATTPWGTVLTCEENFQEHAKAAISPAGKRDPDTEPFGGTSVDAVTLLPDSWDGLGSLVPGGLDGRTYGWVSEIDPETGGMVKHTALGRFQHENVGLRCVAGERLAAYMGDDRPGGHLWKFVSDERVRHADDPANSRLFAKGRLYVAKFAEDFTGRWIPLDLDTPLARPDVERPVSGHRFVPRRPDGGPTPVVSRSSLIEGISVDAWVTQVERFSGKRFESMTLGDLVTGSSRAEKLGVILMDAFLMANAAGATPTARPEDVEVHPFDRSVYVAFTDCTSRRGGSPDRLIFPDSAESNSKQYGAVYRIVEKSGRPESETFEWGRFLASGEAASGGGGLASADNLAFDTAGNLWLCSDISKGALNHPVDREGKTAPGKGRFRGIFGNNALFMIPTRGPNAGIPFCFAVAPCEAELAGVTFTPDGESMLLSIQHPGEANGVRGMNGFDSETVVMRITDEHGRIVEQERLVPRGSNYPSGRLGGAPRPSVVQILRKTPPPVPY